MMLNSCTIAGHLGRDVEVKATHNGKPFTQISIALQVGWGEKKHTVWTSITVFGPQAEWLGEAKKGDLVVCSGLEYDVEEYESKDGEKKKSHKFIAGMGSTVRHVKTVKQSQGTDWD